MKTRVCIAVGVSLLLATSAQAINATYRKQLERSGCTQMSEMHGCDITQSKAENAKSGFVTESATGHPKAPVQTPYAGNWVVKSGDGATLAKIRIDKMERVWVNGKSVKAKRSVGALIFKVADVQYLIQGDRRLHSEDIWSDFKAGTKGFIVAE
jgi:hypothetical protein